MHVPIVKENFLNIAEVCLFSRNRNTVSCYIFPLYVKLQYAKFSHISVAGKLLADFIYNPPIVPGKFNEGKQEKQMAKQEEQKG